MSFLFARLWSDQLVGFSDRPVTRAGLRCHIFEGGKKFHKSGTAKYEEEGMKDGEWVGRWLPGLPKPIGLMACNDMRGQQVLNACRAVGVLVPDDVAVIGVDNEEVLCDLSDPPLSSVVPNTEKIGFAHAEYFNRIFKKKAGMTPAQFRIKLKAATTADELPLTIDKV